MSDDYTSMRLARLGEALESKGDGPIPAKGKGKGKGGKVKPRPPWMNSDEADDPEDQADGGADEDSEDESDDKPPKKKKPGTKGAARPTVWGPPKQSVDISRAGVSGTGSDRRVSREARRRFYGDNPKPGRGSAGGNGATGGRSNGSAVAKRPGNLRGGEAGSVTHSGQMGEGSAWGRSGSAVVPHKPANLKSLGDYGPDEIQSALDTATKALRGYLAEHHQEQ